MFTKIVVGVDGTDQGRDALGLGRTLAGLTEAEIVAVHAYPVDSMPGLLALGVVGEPLRDAADRLVEEECANLPAGARALAVPGSSPARVLRDVVEAEGADLLIVGSSRHGKVGRVLLGDHARQAVHHAPCAVAIAPRGYATAAIREIGVGFDAGPDAQRALDAAVELAVKAGASLRVVAALTPPFDGAATYAYPYPIDWSSYYEHLGRRRQSELDEAVAGLPVAAATEVTEGWAPKVLEDVSSGCDLLVIGSRHWGAVNRLLLGSTSTALIGRAHCPLLVMPRSATDGDTADQLATTAQA